MDNAVTTRIKLICYALQKRAELHDDGILDIAHAYPLDQLRLTRDLLIRIATNSMREAGYIWAKCEKSRAVPEPRIVVSVMAE